MMQAMRVVVIAAMITGGMGMAAGSQSDTADWRNIENGHVIPDEGYCDQPYVVITEDGNWLCVLTTGAGHEGQGGQHIVSTISTNWGKTWSDLIDIEPASGPEASWGVPARLPSGRVYVFYDYNGDRISGMRADMLGWYCYKYSDDNGRTWSEQRYRLPVRRTACDANNGLPGDTQIFWGIDKPTVREDAVYFAFTKLGQYMLDQGEGWMFRSENILTERDPAKIAWTMLPEGEHGIRDDAFGSVQEEHNLVTLRDGTLYCVYRTTCGFPCSSTSADSGRTWSIPEAMRYSPEGRVVRHPRACPKLWKCRNGKYLFWFHNNATKTYKNRNPAWISGGIETNGTIHWSEPEILFYSRNTNVRISYPDLIQQDGRYWITETQKSVARVHEVPAAFFEMLWNQQTTASLAESGKCLDMDGEALRRASEIAMPRLPSLREDGFSIDMWLTVGTNDVGALLLDSRRDNGKGVAVRSGGNGTVELLLSDGKRDFAWSCDAGLITPGRKHHVVFSVDGRPNIVTVVVNGKLCDGAGQRDFGWGRFPHRLRNCNGKRTARFSGDNLVALKLYNRCLRTSEAVGNFNAMRSIMIGP